MGELEPCPFCGSTMQVAMRNAMICLECYASGPQGEDRKALWNRRAIPAAEAPPVQDDAASRRRKIMGHMDDKAAADARAEAWAVFDPNWGEPVPLLTTIRETEADAIGAAITTQERGASMYSGYSTHPVPQILGDWGRMQAHGYRVRRVALITEKQP